MIRLSVFYPTTEGATFDHDYYRDTHVPLCVSTWAPERATIDKGIDGPFVAAVHFEFASLESMMEKLSVEGTAAVIADVANYTTIEPVRQTSEFLA